MKRIESQAFLRDDLENQFRAALLAAQENRSLLADTQQNTLSAEQDACHRGYVAALKVMAAALGIKLEE